MKKKVPEDLMPDEIFVSAIGNSDYADLQAKYDKLKDAFLDLLPHYLDTKAEVVKYDRKPVYDFWRTKSGLTDKT
jgi:hypothetical protein